MHKIIMKAAKTICHVLNFAQTFPSRPFKASIDEDSERAWLHILRTLFLMETWCAKKAIRKPTTLDRKVPLRAKSLLIPFYWNNFNRYGE